MLKRHERGCAIMGGRLSGLWAVGAIGAMGEEAAVTAVPPYIAQIMYGVSAVTAASLKGVSAATLRHGADG